MPIKNRHEIGRNFIDFAIAESVFNGIIGPVLYGFEEGLGAGLVETGCGEGEEGGSKDLGETIHI